MILKTKQKEAAAAEEKDYVVNYAKKFQRKIDVILLPFTFFLHPVIANTKQHNKFIDKHTIC